MYFTTVYFSSVSLFFLSLISYYYFLFLSMLIYGVSYHQCLLNKCQEESSETGINRIYKNSCLPLKKTHFGFLNLTELF